MCVKPSTSRYPVKSSDKPCLDVFVLGDISWKLLVSVDWLDELEDGSTVSVQSFLSPPQEVSAAHFEWSAVKCLDSWDSCGCISLTELISPAGKTSSSVSLVENFSEEEFSPSPLIASSFGSSITVAVLLDMLFSISLTLSSHETTPAAQESVVLRYILLEWQDSESLISFVVDLLSERFCDKVVLQLWQLLELTSLSTLPNSLLSFWSPCWFSKQSLHTRLSSDFDSEMWVVDKSLSSCSILLGNIGEIGVMHALLTESP